MIARQHIKSIDQHPVTWLFRTELYPGDESLLSCAERARAERITNPRRRGELVAGRCAVRRMLAEVTATAPDCVQLVTGENGRPYMAGDSGYDFSISHSHGMCAIAVGRNARVGIDVERITDRARLGRIAEYMFSHDELTAWKDTDSAQRVAKFYQLWTRKEAYLKALGIGLSPAHARSTSTIAASSYDAERNANTEWNAKPEWKWTDIDAPDGYRAALCWCPSEAVPPYQAVNVSP